MSAGVLFVLFLLVLLTFYLGFIIMRNLTPHAIVICSNGVSITIEPSGIVARVSSSEETVGACPITGAPIVRKVFGSVIDIGTPDKGHIIAVTRLVTV